MYVVFCDDFPHRAFDNREHAEEYAITIDYFNQEHSDQHDIPYESPCHVELRPWTGGTYCVYPIIQPDYSQMSYADLYELLGDDEAIESEIEAREVLSFDTDHWLAGDNNHPQALIS